MGENITNPPASCTSTENLRENLNEGVRDLELEE